MERCRYLSGPAHHERVSEMVCAYVETHRVRVWRNTQGASLSEHSFSGDSVGVRELDSYTPVHTHTHTHRVYVGSIRLRGEGGKRERRRRERK
jgi:hypothetical protein